MLQVFSWYACFLFPKNNYGITSPFYLHGKSRHLQDLRSYQTLSDETLIEMYQRKGDVRMLGLVLQRYTILLLGIAFKYLRERAAAEDAVQHVLLHALKHFPTEPVQNLKGWLYILMRNHCLNVIKQQQPFKGIDFLAQQPSENPTFSESELWQKEWQLQRMKQLMKLLPEPQQITLKLFYLENKSYEEIMAITGYDYMQVKSYIQNGKRKMRLLMINDFKNNNA